MRLHAVKKKVKTGLEKGERRRERREKKGGRGERRGEWEKGKGGKGEGRGKEGKRGEGRREKGEGKEIIAWIHIGRDMIPRNYRGSPCSRRVEI